ncbi:LysR substrate-binding domain-containing protein [Bradyrhizobium prioriisuperbiae]|uniref:LysR substrate-binding domain-containing protein n=1 Tax=Bradyrhizobium prioriisuperbiae TaxID=2854389 RepID=UPI0028F061F2|nr:LysR substrate-binding domain-containing protein [Bradyrhizobium prioritasuperba]
MQRSRSSLPPISTLRPFEAAVRLGSFKAAAEELGLTQSAISHQISALETHFRSKLFQRQGNRLVLTKAGSTYGAAVLRAFSEMARAGETLLSSERQEIVRVSATPSFAAFAALPNIAAFKAINGSLDLRLEARNTGVDFDTETIDAAIVANNPPFPGLQAHRLFRSKLAPLARPELRAKFPPVKTPHDLLRLPLIELNNIPGMWERWFAKADPKVKLGELRLSSDSLLAAIQMAEAGVGVVLAPFPLAAPVVAAGRLDALFRPTIAMERPDIYLVYRKTDAGSAKIKAVRRWIKDIIAGLERRTNTTDL